jgi:Fuc2NAc and GlcNAc transferase
VAIVVPTLVSLLALGWTDYMSWSTALSFCVGGAVIALIGLADDRRHIAPHWRLIGHFALAWWVLARIGGLPPLTAFGFVLEPGWFGYAMAALFLVWMINLTNFMDGIDGIAGVEVVTVCLSAAFLSEVAAPGAHLWIAPLMLAAATLGFLVWNWPPAKIFMGDAGSGFLGLMFGVLSLQAGLALNRLFWTWVILLGVFVVDATVTVINRMARRERFHEAHRSHAYQHAAVLRGAHLPVAVAVGVINLCWLLPVALAVALGRLDGFLAVLVSYVPLVVAAVRLKAGRPSTG